HDAAQGRGVVDEAGAAAARGRDGGDDLLALHGGEGQAVALAARALGVGQLAAGVVAEAAAVGLRLGPAHGFLVQGIARPPGRRVVARPGVVVGVGDADPQAVVDAGRARARGAGRDAALVGVVPADAQAVVLAGLDAVVGQQRPGVVGPAGRRLQLEQQ